MLEVSVNLRTAAYVADILLTEILCQVHLDRFLHGILMTSLFEFQDDYSIHIVCPRIKNFYSRESHRPT